MRLIFDGNNLAMRALHAAAGHQVDLSSTDGSPTAALMIFANMVCKYIADNEATEWVMCWDSYCHWRRDRLGNYKGTRQYEPDSLASRGLSLCQEFSEVTGAQQYRVPNFEADDIIGSLAQDWGPCRIVSADKDLLQLLAVPGCDGQWRPGQDDMWDAARVEEEWGVPPRLLSRVMAIMGDKVDGVEGVAGWGPKKSAKLVLEHNGDLDAIITDPRMRDHAERILTNLSVIDLIRPPFRPVLSPPLHLDYNVRGLGEWLDHYELRQLRARLDAGTLFTKPKLGRTLKD